MPTLKELVKKYEYSEKSDYEIIKEYFTKNNLEALGVDMLTELCRETINNQYHLLSNIREFSMYTEVILTGNPKMSHEDCLLLYRYAQRYLLYGELTENALKDIKKLFDRLKEGDLNACPQMFLYYLHDNGIDFPGLDYNFTTNSFKGVSDNHIKLIKKGGQ